MSQHKAIRVGEKMPSQYRKMAEAVCTNCGATFSIVHHYALADAALATDQSDALESILSEEHVDDKFQDHPPSYDLDN
jgi:hypothetical protein